MYTRLIQQQSPMLQRLCVFSCILTVSTIFGLLIGTCILNIRHTKPTIPTSLLFANMAGNYTDVYTRLKSLPRQEANWWLSENVDNLEGEEWDNYRKGRRQEFHHFDHVRSIMKILTGEDNNHDHSKDEWFLLVAVGRFTLGYADLLGDAFQSVVQDHYRQEAHHPEHETFPGNPECSDTDILEMAIDRLSRELQFNQGEYNWENMKRFEPSFTYDTERKLNLYRERSKENASLCKEIWDSMQSINK